MLTVEKAAETHRPRPGKCLSGCLICCELIITKWFCVLRVKMTYFQVGEKAADKTDDRETLWS